MSATYLKVAGSRRDDDPATWDFNITGLKAPPSDKLVVDWGDGSAVETFPLAVGQESITVAHTYIRPGRNVFTSVFTSAIDPYAKTLQALADKTSTLQGISQVPSLKTLADIPRAQDQVAYQAEAIVGEVAIWAEVLDDEPSGVIKVATRVATRTKDSQVIPVTSWRISRQATGYGSQPLQEGSSSAGATGAYEDWLAPFDVPITYRLEVLWADGHTNFAVSNTVRITDVAGCWLSDAYHPFTTMNITLQAWPQRSRAARRAVLAVAGRPDPVVISDEHLWPSGTWNIYTETDAELAQLLDVLTGSRIVKLRTQPDSSIATVYASVGRVDEDRRYGVGGNQERFIAVEVQEVAPIPAIGDLSATLQQLSKQADTLAGLAQVRQTLLQLSRMRFKP